MTKNTTGVLLAKTLPEWGKELELRSAVSKRGHEQKVRAVKILIGIEYRHVKAIDSNSQIGLDVSALSDFFSTDGNGMDTCDAIGLLLDLEGISVYNAIHEGEHIGLSVDDIYLKLISEERE